LLEKRKEKREGFQRKEEVEAVLRPCRRFFRGPDPRGHEQEREGRGKRGKKKGKLAEQGRKGKAEL